MAVTITLNNVGHGFTLNDGQKIELFDGVSLNIDSGKSCAIMGASGSGKSTLLSIMAGLQSPNRGQVSFSADNQMLDADGLRRRSGFVFQHFHLLEELNALDNVALPLRLRGDKKAREKAADWLDKVMLGARATQPVHRLSGGEQQRLAIARAFAAQPDVVFADEPTGSLDEHTAEQVSELMFQCQQQSDASLVMVTHNPDLARRAQYQYVLSHGQLGQMRVAA